MFGAAIVLSAARAWNRAALRGSADSAPGAALIGWAIAWGACAIVVAAVGFVAGWRERRRLLKVHLCLLVPLQIFTIAIFIALALRGTAGFVDDHCGDVLEFLGEEWFSDWLQCSKYGGPAAEFASGLPGCLGPTSVEVGGAAAAVDALDRARTLGDVAVSWEAHGGDAAAIAGGRAPAHVATAARGEVVCLVACLDNSCCRVLKEQLAAAEIVLCLWALIFVGVLLFTWWGDWYVLFHQATAAVRHSRLH